VEDDGNLFLQASNGDLEAMFRYGQHLRALNLLEGPGGAIFWLRKACNSGHSVACEELGEVLQLSRKSKGLAAKKKDSYKPSRGSGTTSIPRQTSVSFSYKEKLDRLCSLKGLRGDETFKAFQINPTITLRQAIAYAYRYGLNHNQELARAIKCLNLPSLYALGTVDVLDIGCGPAMTLDVLRQLGLHSKSNNGFDHAGSFVWLARELNSQFTGQYETHLERIQISPRTGFVVMNHVLNQSSVDIATLELWAGELKRIYFKGFYLLSIEPTKAEYLAQTEKFQSILSKVGLRQKLKKSGRCVSNSKKKIEKSVNFLLYELDSK